LWQSSSLVCEIHVGRCRATRLPVKIARGVIKSSVAECRIMSAASPRKSQLNPRLRGGAQSRGRSWELHGHFHDSSTNCAEKISSRGARSNPETKPHQGMTVMLMRSAPANDSLAGSAAIYRAYTTDRYQCACMCRREINIADKCRSGKRTKRGRGWEERPELMGFRGCTGAKPEQSGR